MRLKQRYQESRVLTQGQLKCAVLTSPAGLVVGCCIQRCYWWMASTSTSAVLTSTGDLSPKWVTQVHLVTGQTTTAPSFNMVISTLGYQRIQRSSHENKNTWLVFCVETVWLHLKKLDISASTVICKYFSYPVNGIYIYIYICHWQGNWSIYIYIESLLLFFYLSSTGVMVSANNTAE